MKIRTVKKSDGQGFQKCGSCGRVWDEWKEFILDPGVHLLGFQAIATLPDANLLVFDHRCGSSISVLAKRLRHLFPDLDEEPLPASIYDSETCNHYCREIENLETCDRSCANARDRRMIHRLVKMRRGEQ
jgi:hypothetical protein